MFAMVHYYMGYRVVQTDCFYMRMYMWIEVLLASYCIYMYMHTVIMTQFIQDFKYVHVHGTVSNIINLVVTSKSKVYG